jgi:hypothetical protein
MRVHPQEELEALKEENEAEEELFDQVGGTHVVVGVTLCAALCL